MQLSTAAAVHPVHRCLTAIAIHSRALHSSCAALIRLTRHLPQLQRRPCHQTTFIRWQSRGRPRLAVPFAVSDKEAQAAMLKGIGGMFSVSNFTELFPPAVRKEFLPFYAFDVVMSAIVECEFTYTPPLGKPRRVSEFVHLRNHSVDFSSPYTQILATFDHRRSVAERLAGDFVVQTVPIDEILQDDETVLPFSVSPDYAIHFALPDKLKEYARLTAKSKLESALTGFQPDMRTAVQSLQIHNIRRHNVWCPYYVFEYSRFDRKFTTLVHGFTAKPAGIYHLSGTKISFLLFGTLMLLSRLRLLTVLSSPMSLLISVVAGVFTHYLPSIQSDIGDFFRKQEMRRHADFLRENPAGYASYEHSDSESFARGRERAQAFEEAEHQRAFEQERADQNYWFGTDEDDLSQHYRNLGLDPSRSHNAKEVKDAFRRYALKHHPDKVSDPKKKDASSERFKRAVESYNYLLKRGKGGSSSA